jgi:hypothetical protein
MTRLVLSESFRPNVPPRDPLDKITLILVLILILRLIGGC